MRKIGIITFHTAENYGAILQAYALQKYIKYLYPLDEVKIINFNTSIHKKEYNIFRRRSLSISKNILLMLLVLLRYKFLKSRKNKFKLFLKEEISLTNRYYTEEDLLTNIIPMDIYITGSDQVFNPYNAYTRAYYLAFKNKNCKKIAYAPSFGIKNFTQEITEKIEPFLNDFDFLSCRELDGSKFISNLVNKHVPLVCDPVFLLEKEQWNKIAISPKMKYKYIFVYDLNGGNDLIQIANKIKDKTGYKIVCQTQNIKSFYKVDKLLFNIGPKEFIGLIASAEYVVTDSFHGTAFSLIMQTKFFSYIAIQHSSSRITNFLSLLDLNEQLIENKKHDKFIFNNSNIKNYNSKLNNFIELSKKYLSNALN